MSKICSELYRDFFYKINGMTFEMDEFISKVSGAMPEIAQVLEIGCCAETFIAPENPFNLNGINQSVTFYKHPETFVFHTGEGGSLSISFYPKKGHIWNEAELADISFIA